MCKVDEIFTAISSERRRLTLYHLERHLTLSLPDLAELVAETERGKDVRELTGERIKRVYMSLYHRHVPRLEAAELVRYDQETDVVRRTEAVPTALDTARETLQRIEAR
ncbi:hypothetical protein ACFQL1_07345 [Halomicroarcula sp. GCM10025709]|uniref:DUF7344 domain-containing protein n=1 Tax=Haloarcula TaxID=2237 RepID=UPI0024C3B925|nr:hypothetical protein [Halomicroarcula sp. YJ-61-S]